MRLWAKGGGLAQGIHASTGFEAEGQAGSQLARKKCCLLQTKCHAAAAAVLRSLIFDLQMVMGNGELALSPDEYILATLNLYLVRQGGRGVQGEP